MNDPEQKAIERLKAASEMSLQAYQRPLVVTTSGGKDSSVCVQLAINAGIPFEVMHNHTTADAPETVYFVRSEFRRLEEMGIKCTINYPMYKGKRTSMWSLIPQKLMPPTRIIRYCCAILKEHGGDGRFITTGVRWAESEKRKKNRGIYEIPGKGMPVVMLNNDNDDRRRLFETCALKAKRICNPIIDWEDTDVWAYIKSENIPFNPLYERGFCRVGCVGCPLAGTVRQKKEFLYWPPYQDMYIAAFDRMLIKRRSRRADGSLTTPMGWLDNPALSGADVFRSWVDGRAVPGQMEMDDMLEDN